MRTGLMRTATTVEASAGDRWAEQVDFVVEAEKLGLDVCWVAEAWGSDGPSALGYYAARTDRMLLGSGIMQVGTRTPVAVAQTAITLSNLSDGRFLLGLGASGPQVIEGLHGVPFARPLARMRETVAIAPDEDALREMVAGRKKELAFSLGGMGSASTNFYNKAYSRQGWAEIAAEVRERWQAGDRDGAAALVT